jgi:hypothetical protein
MSLFRSTTVFCFVTAALVVFCLPVSSSGSEVIYGVRAWASPTKFRGPCPKQIRFFGRIEVNSLPGAVLNYHWERNDGAQSPVKMVRIRPGQRTVTVNNHWTVDASGPLQQTLVVNSGNQHIRAETNPVNLVCR